MERWAKSLNRHKENMRTATAAVPPTLPPGQMRVRGHGRLDDNKESASADAGYAVLEKKVHVYTYSISCVLTALNCNHYNLCDMIPAGGTVRTSSNISGPDETND